MSELSTDSVLAGLLAELLEQSRSGGTADLEGMLRSGIPLRRNR